MIVINTDGGSRGNPGLGGWGVVVCKDGEILKELKGTLDHVTNNQAEYTALIMALEWCLKKDIEEDIHIFADSQLMVRQMQGRYAVHSEELKSLWKVATTLSERIRATIRFQHVKREQNRHADRLCNEAMDARK